jgi:hypothetical protein
MNIYDACFRTNLRSPTQEFDADATEYASRLAQYIADEHSDSLGLDDDDACNALIDDIATCGEDDGCLYVELGKDAIRERAIAVDAAKGGAA